MQKILLSLILALAIVNVSGKAGKNKSKDTVHKIVFQLTTNDTMAHKSLMKQLNNITSVAPSTKIEVVCHGPGLDMLVTKNLSYRKK